ncbi:DUF938 domain-containing protein [Phaeobacter sp. HF9A]|uniref:DUF938 domain-containing protein n=1 Tax=Phaeobacter sp. HF9A TaxID=2721561 RepID=UPI00142FA3E5|nr:DUF938 domain-containing protein [Phaeobacter sp. HF9A]NIZ14056.1 DUF938 domain-containing protein [Phaeobacter sp. HF9A]
MPLRSVPGQASVATPAEGGKLFAASAARNLAPLLEVVRQHAPEAGCVLEIASGTGQHVTGYARALPALQWQPSDIDAARRASIDAHVAEAGLENVAQAVALDAALPGWGAESGPFEMILLANLLHLISADEARTVLREASQALAPGGRMILYGPFSRDGKLVSAGDRSFHAALTDHDPEIGYKDVAQVMTWAAEAGLLMAEPIEMPASNLCLVLSA